MGVNTVEREGISYSHPAHFILVGTMNPEEEELRPQLLDRFGLCALVEGIRDIEQRVEVVKRRMEYERDPESFLSQWYSEQEALRKKIIKAQSILSSVTISDEVLHLIANVVVEMAVQGHRADITMVKAASTLAAYDGKTFVTEEDVKEAADLVLPHRMRRHPFEEPEIEQERLEQLFLDKHPTEGERGECVFEVGEIANRTPSVLAGLKAQKSERTGRRAEATGIANGKCVKSRIPKDPDSVTDIAFDSTIRAAAPYQKERGRIGSAIAVEKADIREKVRSRKTGSTILFVVDSSGSMGANERMKAAKGAVLSFLLDAYKCRDKVGLIAFRGDDAAILLNPTSSVEIAQRSLEELPTGGKTPLAQGLMKALEVIEREKRKDPTSLCTIVLVTARVPFQKRTSRASKSSHYRARSSIVYLPSP
jgi:magnesium chelatase subunit D